MVDCDPVELGRNRPLAVGLASHIGLTLRALGDALPRDAGRARSSPGGTRCGRRRPSRRRGSWPSGSRTTCRSATTAWATRSPRVVDARDHGGGRRRRRGRLRVQDRAALAPGPVARSRARSAAWASGPSFAIAAKLLRPSQRVLLIAGDGAFGLNGMEMETAVRFGLPMTVVIGNDGGWGQIRNPQLSFFGAERAVGTSLPFTRFDRMVEALGGKGDPRDRAGPAPARRSSARWARARSTASTSCWTRPRTGAPARFMAIGAYEDHVPLSASADRGRRAGDPHPRRPAGRGAATT